MFKRFKKFKSSQGSKGSKEAKGSEGLKSWKGSKGSKVSRFPKTFARIERFKSFEKFEIFKWLKMFKLTRNDPPDPPKACCQTLVVGMWKCSPPQSQHFNSLPFPIADSEERMRRVRIEPLTLGLRDLRAANCAIAAHGICIAHSFQWVWSSREVLLIR